MNKLLLSVFLLLILSTGKISASINFQSKQDIYDFYVKSGIIRMTYVYMEGAKNTKQEIESLRKFKNSFKVELNYNDFTNLNEDYNRLSIFLSENSWDKTEKNILAPLVEKYNSKYLLDTSFFSFETIDESKLPESWKNESHKIIERYRQALKSLSKSPAVNKKIAGNKFTYVNTEKSFLNKNVSFILYFISLSIILILFLYILTRNAKDAKRAKHNFRILFDSFHQLKAKMAKSRGQYHNKAEYEKLNAEIINLSKKVAALENSINNQNKNDDEYKNKSDNKIDSNLVKASNKISVVELYFGLPNKEGEFNAKEKKDMLIRGETFYKITTQKNSKKGKVNYISSDFDKRAIENIEAYITRACRVKNMSDRAFKAKIEELSPGSVELINDKWKVKEKIRVKLA